MQIVVNPFMPDLIFLQEFIRSFQFLIEKNGPCIRNVLSKSDKMFHKHLYYIQPR